MTAKETHPRSFAPLPIRDVTPEDDEVSGPISYGWCRDWCGVLDDPTRRHGATVAEHGPWCRANRGRLYATDHHGRRFNVWPGLAQMYLHGVYEEGLYDRPRELYEPFVRLGLMGEGVQADEDDGECKNIYLTPGEARQFAALLVYLADESEGLHAPFQGRSRA